MSLFEWGSWGWRRWVASVVWATGMWQVAWYGIGWKGLGWWRGWVFVCGACVLFDVATTVGKRWLKRRHASASDLGGRQDTNEATLEMFE